MSNERHWWALFMAWLLSLLGTVGSLFFSEVMSLPPCNLCWYQRIALYPLVVILAIGFHKRDVQVTRYAWPLVGIGLFFGVYHNLLYYGIIPESISPCTGALSCTQNQLEAFGFITIPMLAVVGFLGVAAFLWAFEMRRR